MPHIAILMHEQDRLDEPNYILNEMAEVWRSEGHHVSVLQGVKHLVEADLVILHVDLTVVPDEYIAFACQYPMVINGATVDTSKHVFSTTMVRRNDSYKGAVIVKTKRNCGGVREARLASRTSPLRRYAHGLFQRLPWSVRPNQGMSDYRIYASINEIPLAVWYNPYLLVEKYLPERYDDYYCLRIWLFLGDKERHSLCYSHHQIVKSTNILHREILDEVPKELRQMREDMGFDFGKFDYGMIDGRVILYDVNRTPTFGSLVQKDMMPSIRLLAQGIYGYLPEKKSIETGHWYEMAQVWQQIGVPLRPSGQDLGYVKKEIGTWVRERGVLRALILGVTPELYHLLSPEVADLLAIDHTQSMIDAVWPGPRESAICADWTAMPLKTGSRDMIVCDGGIILMRYPDEHRAFINTLHRVISPGGLCLFRLLIPPQQRESTKEVLEDLLTAKIPNLNILKIRLGMALQATTNEGVELKKVWHTLHEAAPDFEILAEKIGWPLEHLLTINTYRDSPNKYYFLSLDDVQTLFCKDPGGFSLEKVYEPLYELGERCPTVVFRRNEISD